MSTRSLTVVMDGDYEVCVLYRQMDGYPSGHGVELAEFLDGFTITNGLTADQGKTANGAGCLAAQLVAYFKTGAGGFYLYPSGARDVSEEFVYVVRPVVGQPVEIEVEDFKGTPQEFLSRFKD